MNEKEKNPHQADFFSYISQQNGLYKVHECIMKYHGFLKKFTISHFWISSIKLSIRCDLSTSSGTSNIQNYTKMGKNPVI